MKPPTQSFFGDSEVTSHLKNDCVRGYNCMRLNRESGAQLRFDRFVLNKFRYVYNI